MRRLFSGIPKLYADSEVQIKIIQNWAHNTRRQMGCRLALCPWAAAAFLLILCDALGRSMALWINHVQGFRTSCQALVLNAKMVHNFKRTSSLFSSSCTVHAACHSAFPRRGGVRRGRARILHSNAQVEPTPCTSHTQQQFPSVFSTAMDRTVPFFGRCVGVSIPSVLTTEVVAVAKDELMPEEMAYCLKLPTPLQVSLGSMWERCRKIVSDVLKISRLWAQVLSLFVVPSAPVFAYANAAQQKTSIGYIYWYGYIRGQHVLFEILNYTACTYW